MSMLFPNWIVDIEDTDENKSFNTTFLQVVARLVVFPVPDLTTSSQFVSRVRLRLMVLPSNH